MARRRIFLALAIGLAASALIALMANDVARDLASARDLSQAVHAPSDECRRCHPSHYESWSHTFHRTMTQEASEASVLGDFDGTSFEYGGIRAHMERTDQGGFRVRFTSPGGGLLSQAEVVRTVGSRRVQQYLARDEDVYFRLPIAWNVEEGRFMHMNGAFLTPDPPEPERGGHIAREDYDRHVTRWNDNCVFCHNVAPNPGLSAREERFRTEVAELGIACGACHGPADEHARVNGNPLRRYALHLSDGRDPTIVNPARLSPERSAQVCGRCHGQRITANVGRFLREGDPFVPGQPLTDYSRPLARDTTLNGEPGVFANRFWPDGTARLTAYEYQGLIASACAQGGMTCTSCHGMHEGDPRGQLRDTGRGDGACTSCHEEIGADASAHSRHRDVECVECHMPRIVYGIVEVHRSHRVEIPDLDAERPDACTLCHVERTRRWARQSYRELWAGPSDIDNDTTTEQPRVMELALSGDPIERAVASAALGRLSGHPRTSEIQYRLSILLDTMSVDPYPAIRRIAWRSVRSLAPGAQLDWMRYEPTASTSERTAWVESARRALGNPPVLDPALVASMRARAAQVAIEIGE